MIESIAVAFGVPLASGVLTALVSVHLALRRFRAERWWERKAEAYSSLLTALFDVQRSLSAEVRRMEGGAELSEAYRESLTERARAGYAEIRRASVLGTFLFNAKATSQIKTLVDQLDGPGYSLDLLEECHADLIAVTSALEALKTTAKGDLSVRR